MPSAKKTRSIVEREEKINKPSLFFVFLTEVKMLERHFQSSVIKEIKTKLKGCIVLKTDPTYKQGLPDLLILYNKRWAALEIKKSKNAHKQPNQEFYISKMNKMSFAKFIYPENRKEIIDELCKALQSRGSTRISKR